MAGLDGIRNKIEPPKPIDKNLYELEPEEAAKVNARSGPDATQVRRTWELWKRRAFAHN